MSMGREKEKLLYGGGFFCLAFWGECFAGERKLGGRVNLQLTWVCFWN